MGIKIFIVLFGGLCCWILYLLISTLVGNALLKKEGKCSKAILTKNIINGRYQKSYLEYEFTYKGKTYTGNSLEEDLTKAGDSICIIYLESHPGTRRPIKYFDEGEIKCDCSQ
ncbi:MAG TPA: hypothetical protein VK718_06080 [Ferruginibacter sp.]|jgi:hypothetical protein|nr:hypothetical protein [Ferruginibacter sp.]